MSQEPRAFWRSCRALGATRHVTGHAALGDLRHEVFEAVGIAVDYLEYHLSPYPRQHGGFEPYVTALDLLANAGPEARAHVNGRMVPWPDMVAPPAPAPADTR